MPCQRRVRPIIAMLFGPFFLLFLTMFAGQSMAALPGGLWVRAIATDCALWDAEPEPGDAVAWSGSCVAGKAEGAGIAIWSRDGVMVARYEGEFRAGRRHGAGRWIAGDGLHYEGQWRSGRANGSGSLVTAAGDRYSGSFKDQRFHGHGIWVSASGERYEGQFLDGKFHGQGTLTYAEGGGFVGRFRDGLFNGHGVLLLVTGQGFIGDFRRNRPQGQGLCTFADEAPRDCLFDGGAFVAWAN